MNGKTISKSKLRIEPTKAHEARSVVGMCFISTEDPELRGADAAIRALFDNSLKRSVE